MKKTAIFKVFISSVRPVYIEVVPFAILLPVLSGNTSNNEKYLTIQLLHGKL